MRILEFLLKTLLIAGLAFLVGRFTPLPWWSVAVIAFLVGILFGKKPKKRRVHGKMPKRLPFSFLSGFIAIFFLWGGMAIWMNSQNDSLLGDQIFQLLPLSFIPETLGPYALALISALLGGLVGGLSSLTGNAFGEAIK